MISYTRIAALGLALLALLGLLWKAYDLGGDRVRLEWQEEKAQLAIQQENLRLLQQAKVTKVAKGFTEKTTKDRVVTITLIKEVDKYVPSTLPMLPGSFRVYHDAAATGDTLGDPSGADASPVTPKDAPEGAPVPVRDLASTLAENYASCRYDQERLMALQEILRIMTEKQ